MPSRKVDELKRMLAARFPDAELRPRASTRALPTGIEGLDALLPDGGLPCGVLSTWSGPGGAAVARRMARGLLAENERVFWIDGTGSLGPQDLPEGIVCLRPGEQDLGAAERILSSGGASLVVLRPHLASPHALLRLGRAARDGSAVLLALGVREPAAAVKIRASLQIPTQTDLDPLGHPLLPDALPLRLEVSGRGGGGRVTLPSRLHVPRLRLCLDPRLPDRRGSR